MSFRSITQFYQPAWVLLANTCAPGLLPIIQWLTSLERNPPPTRQLHTIERLQGWSMLCYYPLEHVYYLLSHSIIPSQFARPSFFSLFSSKTAEPKDSTINLNAGEISRLSVRFWALYVFLQFAHLREDRKLLMQRERALGKSKVNVSKLSRHTNVLSVIRYRLQQLKQKRRSSVSAGMRYGVKSSSIWATRLLLSIGTYPYPSRASSTSHCTC